MTVTELHPHRDMTDAEKRDAARAAARANPDISGAELGRMFGQKAAWGVDQKNVELHGTRRPGKASRRVAAPRDTTPDRDTPTATRDEPPMPRHAEPAERPVSPAETPRASEWVHRVTLAGVLIVAGTAAVISYEHMRHLAMAADEGWRAWFVPLSVDGLMVTASMTALTRRRDGRPVGWLAWTSLLLGVAASVAANIAAADPTLVDPKVVQRIVAAWPPIALGLSFELLLQQGRKQ